MTAPRDEVTDPAIPKDDPSLAEVEYLTASRDEPGVVLYDPLRRYLHEVQQFPTLSAEEEKALAVRYSQGGDVDAAYQLVTSHLRLVVRIAFHFKRSWLNLLDLIQEGNVGLLLAVQKFDPYRGIRLSTYAAWWIRAYIIKFLLDNWRLVKVGTTNARRRLLFNLRREKEALVAQGIVPAPRLLAERLNVSEQDVVEVERSLGAADLSLESPVSPGSDRLLGDTLAASDPPLDEQVELRERQKLLDRKLREFEKGLSEREQAVFRERLLAEEPATLQLLGDRFGITREGLRQVEKRLLVRLREFLAADPSILELLRLPGAAQDRDGLAGTPPDPVTAPGDATPARAEVRSLPPAPGLRDRGSRGQSAPRPRRRGRSRSPGQG